MVVPEHLPTSSRAGKRWGAAAASSAGICALWFAYLDRDGCWLYWHGTRGLGVFTFPLLWLALLFGFRMKGRFALVALTLLGLLFWPHVDTLHAAAAESRAVGRLRELRSALESYKIEQRQPTYPRTLPDVPGYPLENTYRFEYFPSVSPDGTIVAYVIKATPVRRSCGCTRSFTIAEDGRLYYTLQDRAATVSDQLLQ